MEESLLYSCNGEVRIELFLQCRQSLAVIVYLVVESDNLVLREGFLARVAWIIPIVEVARGPEIEICYPFVILLLKNTCLSPDKEGLISSERSIHCLVRTTREGGELWLHRLIDIPLYVDEWSKEVCIILTPYILCREGLILGEFLSVCEARIIVVRTIGDLPVEGAIGRDG